MSTTGITSESTLFSLLSDVVLTNQRPVFRSRDQSEAGIYLVGGGQLGDVALHLDDPGEGRHGLQVHRHDLHLLSLLLWPLKLSSSGPGQEKVGHQGVLQEV